MNSLEDLHRILDSLPGNYLILRPDPPRFTIAYANQAYLKVTLTKTDIEGKALFEVFTDNPDNPEATGIKNFTASLMEVMRTKRPHSMKVQRYDIKMMDGAFEERHWQPINIPVIDDTGNISFIIHNVDDVTMEVVLRKKLQKGNQRNQKEIQNAIVTTQEIERMDIARELHDNINQILLTARLYLEHALSKQTGSPSFLSSGIQLLERAMLEIRLLSRSLFMPFSGEENLSAAVDQLLEHLSALRSIIIHKELNVPENAIDIKSKQTIFRIVQEQVNNVIKHSNAKNLWIKIHSIDNNVQITIKDDGIGFNPIENVEGVGFKSIRDRVRDAGGTLEIRSVQKGGCTIEVLIPQKR
jgi:signal transduction histidine kinase